MNRFFDKASRLLRQAIACSLSAFLLLLPPATTALALSISASGDSLSGELTVLTNHSASEMQPYQELFTRKYPHASISYIYLENYDQQAYERILSNDYGDVLFIPASLPDADCEQYFEVLGDYTELSDTYNFLEQSRHNDSKVYGIPSSAYVNGFVYNKSVFEQAGITRMPQTPEEFLEDLSHIKNYTDATPFYTNYISSWALGVWENFPYIELTGNAKYKSDIFPGIENPFTRDDTHRTVYTLLYDIVENNLSETVGSGTWDESKAQLNEGSIGCVAIGSWALQQFKSAGAHGDDVAFMPFPYNIDGTQYVSISTDYSYAVNRNSEHIELAKAYISFMLDESGYALNNNTLSILKTDPYPDGYENLKTAVLLSPASPASENEGKFAKLSSGLNLTDGSEQQRIIEAACGISSESLDEIFAGWDSRWESSRTPDMQMYDDSTTIFSKSAVTMEDYTVSISASEQLYIDAHPTLTVGYLRNLAPFQYEADNKFAGVSYSLCEMIREHTGITLTYAGYDNYEALTQALDSGSIDFIAGIEDASGFSDDIQLSRAYADYMLVLIRNTTADLSQIEQKRVAVTDKDSLDYFRNLSNIVPTTSLPESIAQVNQLHADYTIANYYSANFYLKDQNYNNTSILPLGSGGQICLGFAKDADIQLIAICNKCIYAIPDEQMELLLLNSMAPSVQKITPGMLIRLYPVQFVAGITLFFLIIVIILAWSAHERQKSAKARELDANRYRILASLADEYVFEYSYDRNMLSFDEKFASVFSFPQTLQPADLVMQRPNARPFVEQLESLKDSPTENSRNFLFCDSEGQEIWYRLVTARIYDQKHHPIQMIGKVVNIQDEMEEHLQLLEKAERDPLTGLFNREGFQSIYRRLCARQTQGSYVLGILDLDNFKSVNDSLGHAGGDEALCLLASELSAIMDAHGIVSRYGGDEFMFYIPEAGSEEFVRTLLEKLVNNMNRTMPFDGKTHALSISVGAVFTPCDTSYEDAFTAADKTLYEIKEAGKNNYRLAIIPS